MESAPSSPKKESCSKIPRRECAGSANNMKLETKAVHHGDRKKAGNYIPSSTPIHTAASYFYDSMDQLDRIFAHEEQGPSYARYDNPTRSALEELVNSLEGGHGAVACSSGMAAM